MKINVPSKIISVNVVTSGGLNSWPFNDGSGDTFWSGGTNPKPYQWQISGTVTTQFHSSHLTREPNQYNGLDIFVGDYIAGSLDGIVLKVVEVIAKDVMTFTLKVEDEYRYNTFRSQTGAGIFSVPGTAMIFNINQEGDPILDPMPALNISVTFFANIESRFDAFRLQDNFPLHQVGHSFTKGDPIAIDPITKLYELADNNSYDRLIGTVNNSGPGPDQFLLSPTTRVIEHFMPPLPGIKGDFIYTDPANPGSYTTQQVGRELFLQLTNPVPSIISGTAISATVIIGNIITINGIAVTLSGTTIASTVSDINLLTLSHGVTASLVNTPTTVTTNLANLKIGAVALFNNPPGPATATINGQLVIFSDGTDGLLQFGQNAAIDSDMARTINAANIPNIIAVGQGAGANLTLTNTAGGPITIVNVNNDRDGTPFAGTTSGSGLAVSTLSSSNTIIKLSALKGQGIILQNTNGTPVTDMGLVSVDNGKLPIALVIEQGIRKGDMFVVSNIIARNALQVLIGDQSMVLDKGDGNWGMYLYNGTSWIVVSTQESARVDSRTLSVLVDFSSLSAINIGIVNAGVRVSPISIEVITPFNGSPIISVGDIGDISRLMSDTNVDLSTVGTYINTPSYQYPGINDETIFVTFAAVGATIGQARVTITYS